MQIRLHLLIGGISENLQTCFRTTTGMPSLPLHSTLKSSEIYGEERSPEVPSPASVELELGQSLACSEVASPSLPPLAEASPSVDNS